MVFVALRELLGSSVSDEPDSAAVVVAAESLSSVFVSVADAAEDLSVTVDDGSSVVDDSWSCLRINPSIRSARP